MIMTNINMMMMNSMVMKMMIPMTDYAVVNCDVDNNSDGDESATNEEAEEVEDHNDVDDDNDADDEDDIDSEEEIMLLIMKKTKMR